MPSEGDVFPDDEVVGPAPGRNRNPLDRNVQRVEDKTAIAMGKAFEDFLESHLEEPSSSGLPTSSEDDNRQVLHQSDTRLEKS